MEKVKGWEKKRLMRELSEGKEYVKLLEKRVGSPQECDLLLDKILSSINRSLAILSYDDDTNSVFKKRKMMHKWSEQVRISGAGLPDDGYSWRKYGQKHILGANHQRAYYRCTHRNRQGCFATKQVQKSDEDPSMFKVTYKGTHSCRSSQSEENQIKNEYDLHKQQQQQKLVFNKSENVVKSSASEGKVEMEQTLKSSENGHNEFITTPTSVINSPFYWDRELSVDDDNDDPNLMIDVSEYFA